MKNFPRKNYNGEYTLRRLSESSMALEKEEEEEEFFLHYPWAAFHYFAITDMDFFKYKINDLNLNLIVFLSKGRVDIISALN